MQEDPLSDGVEFGPSSDSEQVVQTQSQTQKPIDQNQQLNLKLQQKLQSLENYKNLCEARIQELCPQHPLPVKQEHLGTEINSDVEQLQKTIQETQIALEQRERDLYTTLKRCDQLQSDLDTLKKQKSPSFITAPSVYPGFQSIDNQQFPSPSNIQSISFAELCDCYSAMYIKFQEVAKDKINLERSLRSEILTTEEQRTYIEVLRQALEQKLEDMGLQDLLGKYQGEAVDIYSELINLKSEGDLHRQEYNKYKNILIDHEHQIQTLKDQLNKTQQDRSELLKVREKAHGDLDKGNQALSLAKQQIQKLETEKQALLDYTDQCIKKEKALISEVNELKELNSKLRSDREEIYTEQNQLQTQQKQMEVQIMEREESIIEMENTKKQYEQKLQKMQENEYLLQKDISSLKEQFHQVSAELLEAQKDIESKNNQIENLTIDQKVTKERFEQQNLSKNYEIDSLNIKIQDKEMTINDKQLTIEQTRQNLEQIKENYESRLKRMENELESLKFKNIEMQRQHENLLENNQILQHTLQDTQSELDQMTLQKDILNQQILEIDRKMSFVKLDRDEIQAKLQEYIKKYQQTETSFLILQQQSEKIQKQLQEDIEDLQNSKLEQERVYKDLRNLQTQEKIKSQSDIKSLDQLTQNMRVQLEEQKESLNQLREKHLNLTQDNNLQRQENQQLKLENQTQNDQIKMLQQKLFQLDRTQLELDRANQDYDQLIDELQQNQSKLNLCKEELEKYKEKQIQAYASSEHLQTEQIRLKSELQNSQEENEILRRKIDSLNNETLIQEKKISNYESQIKQLQADCTILKQTCEELQQENINLKQENQALQEQLQNYSIAEKSIGSDLEWYERLITALKREIAFCNQKIQLYKDEAMRNQTLSLKFKEQISR